MTTQAQQADDTSVLRQKMLRTLRIYGELSPSMLHTGIGPAIPASMWRPILEDLIQEGVVVRFSRRADNRDYTVLKLSQDPTVPTLKQL